MKVRQSCYEVSTTSLFFYGITLDYFAISLNPGFTTGALC